MIESDFRTNLVKWIYKKYPLAFIWVNEAKFKAGFPDLTVIHGGVGFLELKICKDKKIVKARFLELFRPLQVATMKKMVHAGANVRGIVYYPKRKEIVTVEWDRGRWGVSSVEKFKTTFTTHPVGTL